MIMNLNKEDIINLKSDTVTHPTEQMRKAMYEAEVGDDVVKMDPTVIKLQEHAAEMMGMEDALFVPSGTMGNLIALMCHCRPGMEIFLETSSHINLLEGGGVARIAGLMPNQIKGNRGIIEPDDLRGAIRHDNIHFPPPGIVTIENTHNLGGGTVHPLEYLSEYRRICDDHKLMFHMDGARVFNAAAAMSVDVKEIVKYVDSVMFCLSKGLSAPVGSMLCGKKDFIEKAVRIRKMLGGGMRQAGVLAAAGLISINDMTCRLKDDHERAKRIADGLNSIDGITVDLQAVETNLVFMKFDADSSKNAEYFCSTLLDKYNILCDLRNPGLARMVTHRHISDENVDYVLSSARKVMC